MRRRSPSQLRRSTAPLGALKIGRRARRGWQLLTLSDGDGAAYRLAFWPVAQKGAPRCGSR
jgi:hypothetical protein